MIDVWIMMRTELLLAAVLFVVLTIKVGRDLSNPVMLALAQILLLLAAASAFWPHAGGFLFGNMFVADSLSSLQKGILVAGGYLVTLLFSDWLRKTPHLPEFLVLMIASLLGMCFLVSAGNLLMLYLSLELLTIPLAAMANFDLDRKKSAEAAMKLILSSAFSSGILLFGISLVYGMAGTLDFAELSAAVKAPASPLMLLAFGMLFTGFAFKLSIVPFHLWTADVYEGAPIPVTAFLSVMSKGAVAFSLLTVLNKVLPALQDSWFWVIAILAVTTMLIGNLFALRQDNMKRFLAFSSIAQVGFILVAMAGGGAVSATAVTYFIFVYLFSNLAAFGVAAVLEDSPEGAADMPHNPAHGNEWGMEKISEYRGLIRRSPLLAWIMALALFSLAGIPPAAGFFGKLFLLSAGASSQAYWLIIIAALNMMVSLYYYLKIVRSMFMSEPLPRATKVYPEPMVRFGLMLCAMGILLAGLVSWVYEYISRAAA
jgi:NADH-quinone oxidoreductase subunit N